MKKLIITLILVFGLLVAACAAPRGDAAKTYVLQVYANCHADDCTITQTINLTLSAEVKKDQRAEATQETALDLKATGL